MVLKEPHPLLIAVLTLFACGQQEQLPNHKLVDNSSLQPKDGRRIEIHCSNPDLTRDEALLLIEHYRKQAGSEGQIGIHKLNKEGVYLPWAVLNVGEDVKFQDYFFQ